MPAFVLLGAGASVNAGVPTAIQMTDQMIGAFQNNYSNQAHLNVLYFVGGGIQLSRGIQGENPFEGVDIEELFAAVKMLSERQDLAVAPFVGQWHPVIQDLEQPKVAERDLIEFKKITKRFVNAVLENASRKLPHHRSDSISRIGSEFSYLSSGDDIVRFINAHDLLAKTLFPKNKNVFLATCEEMFRALVKMVWIKDQNRIKYLLPLVESARSNVLCVGTLNYDNSIELAAKTANVQLTTGIEHWSHNGYFKKPEVGVELLKLHGSIDWTITKTAADTLFPSIKLRQLSEEKVEEALFREFAIIFGKGNKLDYLGPYLELFRTFRQRIEEHDQLIVIGYSFRDKHINHVIAEWILRADNRQIIIIGREGAPINNPFWKAFSATLCSIIKAGVRWITLVQRKESYIISMRQSKLDLKTKNLFSAQKSECPSALDATTVSPVEVGHPLKGPNMDVLSRPRGSYSLNRCLIYSCV